MKSLFYFLLSLCVINIVFSAESCSSISPSSVEDCTNYTLTSSEKTNGEDTCCYTTFTKADGTNVVGCIASKKKKTTSSLIKELEEETGYTNLSIDCHSNWLSFCLSFLLIGLFF